MLYLYGFTKVNDTKYAVNNIHHMPFDEEHGFHKTQEELEVDGILIEALPEQTFQEGKYGILYCDPATGAAWYEYETIPPAPLTVEQQLQKENVELRAEIAQVKSDSADTTMALLDLYEMLTNMPA